MLKQIFILKDDDNIHWFKIILWWELRRILYNILIIAFGIGSLALLSLIVKDLWSFLSPPISLYMGIGLFLFLANLFYTNGSIFQIMSRGSKDKFVNRVKPRILVYGLLFTFSVQLVPCILAGVVTIITGERIKSVYADFATNEPKFRDIAGEYKLSDKSIDQLYFPEKLSNKTIIRFNANRTFDLKNFPLHSSGYSLKQYEIINATGRWNIEKDQDRWVIPMRFDQIINLKTGQIDNTGFFDSNSFIVKNDDPPYEIYIIVGDPDSWEGVTLQRK